MQDNPMETSVGPEYLPLPISERILFEAQKLKEAGLSWAPEVGHFVWDPKEVIESPSPFPLRVYFILSMKRFLSIFGSVKSMQSALIWVPTWYQVQRIALGRGVPLKRSHLEDPEEEMVNLYRSLLIELQNCPSFSELEG
jgi:hypothetical protein